MSIGYCLLMFIHLYIPYVKEHYCNELFHFTAASHGILHIRKPTPKKLCSFTQTETYRNHFLALGLRVLFSFLINISLRALYNLYTSPNGWGDVVLLLKDFRTPYPCLQTSPFWNHHQQTFVHLRTKRTIDLKC